jgi:hypothetical protein
MVEEITSEDIMVVTKTSIIKLLKEAGTAKLCFHGLITRDQVFERRVEMIREVMLNVEAHNNEQRPDRQVDVVIKDGKLMAGAFTQFLPAYPRTGDVTVGSLGYTVDGVFCAFEDIVPDSFVCDGKSWQFMTKNGTIVAKQ